MNRKIFPVWAGFLTAYALRIAVSYPIQRVWYEETGAWILDNIFELLGHYDFVFLLCWFVCGVFYVFMKDVNVGKMRLLSLLIAVLLPVGQCIRDFGNVTYLFSSVVNIIKTLLIVAGFYIFVLYSLNFLRDNLQKKNFVADEPYFFTNRPFLKAFLILFGVYALVDIVCYPGNLNADTIGQIYQVYGEMEWSQHHPLFSTLITGGFVKFGDVLFHSKAIGLFLYTLAQSAALAMGLAATIWALVNKKLCKAGVWTVLLIYIVTPVYTNIASTAIKDVPFMGFVLLYVVMFTLLIDDKKRINSPKFLFGFMAVQVMTILLRNNGLYMITITGVVAWIAWFKQYTVKERLRSLLGLFMGAAVLATIINSILATALNAEKTGKADMLSLPFQTLGRYYSQFPDDFSDSEREALEAVLGPLDRSLGRYNPALSDHIKVKFNNDCTNSELMNFIKVWIKLFFKHPGIYTEAVLVHTYGWYDPVVSAEIRYETLHDDFLTPTGFFEIIDKGMVFIYRFLNRISLLGALENAGFMMLVYLFVFSLQKEKELKKYRILGVYMFTNLLICMAAPAFLEHTRYGFPILFTVPFVFAYTLAASKPHSFAKEDV